MPLRLADSQLQIFRYQVRQWSQTHRSLARIQLSPVLPVVLYTGVRRWPRLGTLTDLIEQGEEFREEISAMGKTMAEVLIERGRTEGRTEGRSEAAVATRQLPHTVLRSDRR